MLSTLRGHSILTNGDPDDLYPVPGAEAFVTEDGVEQPYIAAHDLAIVGRSLIEAYDQRFYFLQEESGTHNAKYRVAFLWKAEGATSKGQLVLGTCQKPGGLLAHYAKAHWIICVAANHCRDQGLTRFQVEALCYHELQHCDLSEKGEPTIKGHDLEVFASEIEEYGAWKANIVGVARAVQARLPGIVAEGMGLPVGGA